MPSPIAHLTVGYAIYEISRRESLIQAQSRFGPIPAVLAVTALLSILPDMDSVVGILTGNFGRFHNNLTHSLLLGLAVGLGVGALMAWKGWARFLPSFLIALFAYEAHVIMDALTYGRGVMAFWPITDQRFLSPIHLFYGLHWSDGLFSWRHLVTLSTEVVFAAIAIFLVRKMTSRRWLLKGEEL